MASTFASTVASIIAAAIAGTCLPHVAHAQALLYFPLRADARPLIQLVDCRSTVVRHERSVKLGDALTLGGLTLTFTAGSQDGELTVTVTAKPDAKAATQTLRHLPAMLRLTGLGDGFPGEYGLSVRLDDRGEYAHVSSAHGFAFPVGGGHAYIVDSGLDGVVGNQGDGMVADESRTVAPFDGEGEAWQFGGAIALHRLPDGTWEQAALPMPVAANADHARAWRLLNWRRQQCGVLPLQYDDSVERGMRLHADYQITNNVSGHGEDPRHEGYTAEGHRSGGECVLGYGLKTFVENMNEQLDTVFHRNQVLDPALSKTGMILYRDRFALNVRRFKQSPLRDRPIVFPPHGMTDVNPRFNAIGEWPMPVDVPPRTNRLGVCVSLMLTQYEGMRELPRPPTLTLQRVLPSGKAFPIDGDVFYPGHVPTTDGMLANYFGSVSFVPRQPLAPRAGYRARVHTPVITGRKGNEWVVQDFTYEWEFTTGLARRQ